MRFPIQLRRRWVADAIGGNGRRKYSAGAANSTLRLATMRNFSFAQCWERHNWSLFYSKDRTLVSAASVEGVTSRDKFNGIAAN